MTKRYFASLVIVALVLLFASVSNARDLDPIVSTEWLAANLNNPRLVVIDIRKPEMYSEGHIPGALSAYYGMWVSPMGQKHAEYPPEDDLFDAIGDLGIRPNSMVVIVCRTFACFYQVMAPRVLCTLQYAGLDNISILDGGHEKWGREKRPLSTVMVKPKKTVYRGKLNKQLHVEKEYVAKRLGKATFVDTREIILYSGEQKQDFVERAGHIPGSVNLPASEAYTKLGTFKTKEELEALVANTVGSDRSKEIITYCDAGKCCPTWAFIMSHVLGYKNVKLYDGSFEEWTKDPSLPVSR
ncbi:MAG TPA: rhodanese-like domain-containing protein [Syntrophales bacterium]|jgi:thiosulfate/3-mercaptopyruvate sulfurtransferase|nr:rhodanese-like domain-containing protein [Syntrophales bacterium]HOX93939.1 rhodanese-like domain-containing protein [Syntrophales bacterium]HPI56110.1 rhodanese-like domain-containing protein [Syntrophales bacterium]HPN24000.1 rhodanese-like domain-containing protein [Syntrophales bacterium]HQM28279.1 rhodanese-like domain-containing protein [Syntrophales bacterium]